MKTDDYFTSERRVQPDHGKTFESMLALKSSVLFLRPDIRLSGETQTEPRDYCGNTVYLVNASSGSVSREEPIF